MPRLTNQGSARPELIVSAVAATFLIFHVLLRFQYGDMRNGLDTVALGLIGVGLLPWIARLLESFKFGGLELKFVKQQVAEQRREVDLLNFIIANIISKFELEHLRKLMEKTAFVIDTRRYPEDFQREVTHLRDLGFIDNHPGKSVRAMYEDAGTEKSVHDYFYVTEAGKAYLGFRSEMEAGALARIGPGQAEASKTDA